MRRLDYVSLITEDADMLFEQERSSASAKPRQRLQLLRLLKTGAAETMPEAARLVGLSASQASGLWRIYKNNGLDALLETRYKGRIPRLNAEQTTALQNQCSEGFRSLKAAKVWITDTLSVGYSTSGVWRMFERLKNKKKTGRLKHYKQDVEAQEAFKKNS